MLYIIEVEKIVKVKIKNKKIDNNSQDLHPI